MHCFYADNKNFGRVSVSSDNSGMGKKGWLKSQVKTRGKSNRKLLNLPFWNLKKNKKYFI